MNISDQDMKKEKRYLATVKKVANDYINAIDVKVEKEKQDIFEIKKYIWDECKAMSELEYGNLLNDTDAEVKRTNDQIMQAFRYKKIIDNAYFGRVDFKTDGDLINVYIGLHGLHSDRKNYIFDWRAPISSLFYDYTVGKAEYEAYVGKIKGNIELRRQYKIEAGNIKRIIQNDINIDDEILQEVLSSNSSDKMKNIVTTIQKEQNVVIRNTKDKYLIVQGVAGSGKTSVALHRIAYLLYKEENLNYNNILIFSPNSVFSEYISDVLPELGEANVLNTTFNDLVKSYIKKQKNIETFSGFLERKYESINTDDCLYTQNELDAFIKQFLSKSILKYGITINGFYFNQFELNELLTNKYKKLPYLDRIDSIAEYICNSVNISVKKNKTKIKNRLLKEIDIELNPINIYKQFLESKNNGKEINKMIYYDDLVNIIYIYFELNGYPYNANVKHIVVDEAQDYSKLQFLILKKIFPYAYFTILGDVNQAINPYCEYNSLEEISPIFDNKTCYIELNKTYLSSAEIIDFSNKILGINHVSSVRGENGYPVVLKNEKIATKSIINDIIQMKQDGMRTIAVITKNEKDSKNLYKKIKENNTGVEFTLNTITKDCVAILPSYIAKGLEFDGVIVCNELENKYTSREKKLFYVACTRAQHQLIIYNQPQLTLDKPKILKKKNVGFTNKIGTSTQ